MNGHQRSRRSSKFVAATRPMIVSQRSGDGWSAAMGTRWCCSPPGATPSPRLRRRRSDTSTETASRLVTPPLGARRKRCRALVSCELANSHHAHFPRKAGKMAEGAEIRAANQKQGSSSNRRCGPRGGRGQPASNKHRRLFSWGAEQRCGGRNAVPVDLARGEQVWRRRAMHKSAQRASSIRSARGLPRGRTLRSFDRSAPPARLRARAHRGGHGGGVCRARLRAVDRGAGGYR